ncbi:hypothetical protein EJB05_19264, partial [Eragrostis curvula]
MGAQRSHGGRMPPEVARSHGRPNGGRAAVERPAAPSQPPPPPPVDARVILWQRRRQEPLPPPPPPPPPSEPAPRQPSRSPSPVRNQRSRGSVSENAPQPAPSLAGTRSASPPLPPPPPPPPFHPPPSSAPRSGVLGLPPWLPIADRVKQEICVIPRTPEVDANELALSRALLAVVRGCRREVSVDEIKQHLWLFFQVAPTAVAVHAYQPEDWLIMFQEPADLLRVMRTPCIPVASFHLTVKRWSRLGQAESLPLRYQVRVSMTGIPAHLWLFSTARHVLGSSCNVTSMAPETETKANVGEFKVLASCVHPNLIPAEKWTLLPEPGAPHLALYYLVHIRILEVQVLPAPPTPEARPGPPPSDGANGPSGPDMGGSNGRASGGWAQQRPATNGSRKPSHHGRRGTGSGARRPTYRGGRQRAPAGGVGDWPPPQEPVMASALTTSYPAWGLQGIHPPAANSSVAFSPMVWDAAEAAGFSRLSPLAEPYYPLSEPNGSQSTVACQLPPQCQQVAQKKRHTGKSQCPTPAPEGEASLPPVADGAAGAPMAGERSNLVGTPGPVESTPVACPQP